MKKPIFLTLKQTKLCSQRPFRDCSLSSILNNLHFHHQIFTYFLKIQLLMNNLLISNTYQAFTAMCASSQTFKIKRTAYYLTNKPNT
jgi:hypothetical protein